MRRAAWVLLLVVAFAIPWEYSLDFGEPFGNVARVAVIGVLLALIPAILNEGRLRMPGALPVLGVMLLVWFCLSCFWTVDMDESLRQLRGYFQEIVIVWLVWELVDSLRDLRWLLRSYVAGAAVLAVLTVLNFVSAARTGQVRFVAEGHDPNDVARLLDLAFPLTALLVGSESGWPRKLVTGAYFPLGMLGILLTGSRSGLVSATIALCACAALLFYNNRRAFFAGLFALPVLLASAWVIVPLQTFVRLATLPSELMGGDLNQRSEIWAAGWQAFVRAPFCGYGVGSFVAAAGVAPIDTAHNTMLVLVVEGGVIALLIGSLLAVFAVALVLQLRGSVRIALGAALLVWMVSSLVGTVQENRATWLLLGILAVAARLLGEDAAVASAAGRRDSRLARTTFAPPVARESV
ncbi:MAG TPA: O-antigen ligase family protein [Terracidiphilus sp.]